MKRILVLLLSLLMLVACSANKTSQEKPTEQMDKKAETTVEKPSITLTTSFLEDMVNVLLKEKVADFKVELIIPAGEDPHTYEAKPEDLTKLKDASLVLYHGLHFEGKMVEYLEAIKASEVTKDFDHSKLLVLSEDGQDVVDPHFWFDIDLYKQAVTNAANAISEKFPEYKDVVAKNLADYSKQLDDLKMEGQTKINEIPKENRVLITPHDAFSYFSRQYDIEVKAPQGVSTDAELSTNDLIETADFIVERKVKAIFAETTTDPARMKKLQESCASKGHEVKVVSGEGQELYSDSLAPKGHEGDTYISMVKLNIDLITNNLK